MPNKLEDLFGDMDVEITCPSCEHRFMVQLKQISKDKSVVRCPGCSVDIELHHDDTTRKTLHDVNKAATDFDKALKNFEKKLKGFGR